MPERASILDLGCGNGDIAAILQARNPNLQFTGLDLKANPAASIPVYVYDGNTIPYGDNSFDYVMLITVLHHTDDYAPLLKEARRVAREGLIIMDHQYKSKLEWLTLAIIDWPGNVPFGVYTPFNFKRREEWRGLFRELAVEEVGYNDRIHLFGRKLDFILGKEMHFVSRLKKNNI